MGGAAANALPRAAAADGWRAAGGGCRGAASLRRSHPSRLRQGGRHQHPHATQLEQDRVTPDGRASPCSASPRGTRGSSARTWTPPLDRIGSGSRSEPLRTPLSNRQDAKVLLSGDFAVLRTRAGAPLGRSVAGPAPSGRNSSPLHSGQISLRVIVASFPVPQSTLGGWPLCPRSRRTGTPSRFES